MNDVLACAHCGGRLRLIGTLHDPAVIRKILAHGEWPRQGLYLFAINEQTTVTFRFRDASGKTGTATSTVFVKGAVRQLQDLRALVNSPTRALTGGLANNLTQKLDAALAALNATKQQNLNQACAKLTDFITQVNNRTGTSGLNQAEAKDLIADATRIKTVLGCP